MLPSQYRLKRAEIASVLRRGLVFRGPGLTLRVARLGEASPTARLAIVVSAKTVKKAVGRNLLKRRLRHVIRSLASNLAPGYGVVIITFPAAAIQSFAQLKDNLQSLFKQSRLWSA